MDVVEGKVVRAMEDAMPGALVIEEAIGPLLIGSDLSPFDECHYTSTSRRLVCAISPFSPSIMPTIAEVILLLHCRLTVSRL